MTILIGDDQTYFNAFDVQNPKVFFGFSNMVKLIEYVEAIPEHEQGRTNAFRTDSREISFTKTKSMQDALNLAKNGWQEGFERAQEIAEFLNVERATAKKYVSSISGGFVNVAKMLSGDPVHMRKKVKIAGKKNITIFVQFGNLARVKAESMILRACVVGALVDATENAGYSCEIVVIGGSSDSIYERETNEFQLSVTIKHFGEKLNINDLIFSLGHPSFQRRMVFSIVGTIPELRHIWGNQGFTQKMYKDNNDIFVPHLTPEHDQLMNNLKTDHERIKAMFDFVAVNHSKRLGSQFLTLPGNGT